MKAEGLATLADTFVARWFSDASFNNNATLAQHWATQLAQVDDHSYGLLCAWLGERDMTESFKASTVPVNIIGGEKDIATPPELMQSLAKLLAPKHVTMFAEIGHVPSVEAPEQFCENVLSFLTMQQQPQQGYDSR